MSSIAGIASTVKRDLGPLLMEMLSAMGYRKACVAGYTIDEVCDRRQVLETLDFRNKTGKVALGHLQPASTRRSSNSQPIRSANGRLSLIFVGKLFNSRRLTYELGLDNQLTQECNGELLCQAIEKEYRGDLSDTVRGLLPKLDGDYALAVTDQEQTITARDPIGVRQLYYYSDIHMTAFASEKKSLLALGGEGIEIRDVPPGHMMIITCGKHESQAFQRPEQPKIHEYICDPQTAIDAYDEVIRRVVFKLVEGYEHVGIIFSGGIDSFLLAHLVRQAGIAFTCYTAGRNAGATELEYPLQLANEFEFPILAKVLTVDDLKRLIPEVIRDTEDYCLDRVETAIPVYAAIRAAQESGEQIILTSLGADEIFGGHPRYRTIVENNDHDEFVRQSWDDTFRLYREDLALEDKIATAHGLRLLVPYLDPDVIRVAFSIAPELKIRSGSDRFGKRIHRKYCYFSGIPADVAYCPSGLIRGHSDYCDILRKLAEKQGLTPSIMNEVGYDPETMTPEKTHEAYMRDSCSGQANPQKLLPHVQYYLDSHAACLGLLTRLPRRHWEIVRHKLAALGVQISETGTM